ncbi:class I SAM-dependent methyltransferase [Erythrobacter insulae]|uniref:Class I SAM-dependent methyltransferase n=1 Tax=Erythrobacter insulae TaxID=2584124 RepID=A0A547PBY7_9SPHN|nr:class I SAM-dependent methyltransferase [Erythrobacter insulae]TRD11652.1 class I SAM-dependent methyltransferase [Erythrobacter insulae]
MVGYLSEHIQYLRLPHRSDLYRAAISRSLPVGSTVADLGCGVGVLGIFCLEAGAAHVWGIDSSDAIHLAKETVRKAGLSERYTCVADTTFYTDLHEPVDALICDHIGYFGIDYGIVDMMRDAASRMLKPGGVLMPDRIRLHLAGVSSDTCLDEASAWSKDGIPDPFHWIDEQARNSKYAHDFAAEELCSDSFELGEIELSDAVSDYFSFTAELLAARACRFDGLAGWFSAHLGGGVWMTNSPLDAQSIKRSQAFFPVTEPFQVEQGDRIGIAFRARSDGQFLAWNVTPPGGAPVQKQSTWANAALAKRDLTSAGNAPIELSEKGTAFAYIVSLVDGQRTAAEIEAEVMRDRPDLMPSDQATRDFVRSVLRRYAVHD